MAEARSAVSRPYVTELDEGRDTCNDVTNAWRKSFFRRFYRTRNSIRNGMWPTSWYNLGMTLVLTSILLVGDWEFIRPLTSRLWHLETILHLHRGLPFVIRVVILSGCFGLLFFLILMYIRRYLLRILLSYRGWLYEPPHRQSYRTIIWGLFVRCVSGYHPSLYSYQASLPKMAPPPLKQTLVGLIDSLKPLYGPESKKIQELKDQSKEFERTIGNKLQHILHLKSWWSQNYVTDWWEKYVYLYGRSPLLINSNYYILDHCMWKPTHLQCARAALNLNQLMYVKQQVDREQLLPLVIRNTIPLCMSQYERIFSTTRVPKVDVDELVHFTASDSKHIVVLRKGHFYRVTMFDERSRVIPPSALEKQLEWIIKDADKHEISESQSHLASLTGWDRVNWAQTRAEFFSKGINKDCLDAIESSITVVVLDTEVHPTYKARGEAGLLGNGANLWADKSLTIKYSADGKCVINAEHSWADAPVLGHVFEYIWTNEVVNPDDYYDPTTGHVKDPSGSPTWPIVKPARLIWEMVPPLCKAIDTAFAFCIKNNNDLDLEVIDHINYGKGFIKTCKVSPDAYIQNAIQLASYRLCGKFSLTYESCMTRLFVCARTETVRSLTQETVDFVLAMSAQSCDNQLKIRLLRRACDAHQGLYRDAMAGQGIDRHLFALYVLSKGLGYESAFLQSTLTLPWTLSTSQQPQQQIAFTPSCDKPEYQDKVSPGGGFGPVSDEGYGISYMIAGNRRIFFHISSKFSTPGTSSAKMVASLTQALADMKDIFSTPVDASS